MAVGNHLRIRRSASLVAAVCIVAVTLTGCQTARVGARCKSGFAENATQVLICKKGRWTPLMTKAAGLQLLAQIQAQKAATAAAAAPAAPPPPPPPATESSVPTTTTSVPPGPQPDRFRTIYALPSDAVESPAIAPGIAHEMDLVIGWFSAQTGGRTPRLVRTPDGTVDVATVRLSLTAAQIQSSPDPFATVQAETERLGAATPGVATIVYTAADSATECGASNSFDFQVIWMLACTATIPPPSVATVAFPQGSTFVTAHEMSHTFGAVYSCAPHFEPGGHVSDNPQDILWEAPAGDTRQRDWSNIQLDPGHDDYYATGRTDCWDIARSALWSN